MSSVVITPQNPGTANQPAGSVPTAYLPGSFIVQQASGNTNLAPCVQALTGITDVVTFANAVNIAIFTSTGPDAATLAVPAAADVGKVLILLNTNTSQSTVTTTANKILNGTATPGDTLTAPAHAGAVAVLVASNGFWNLVVGGTGSWVLSEV
jgi:hypothetical protein